MKASVYTFGCKLNQYESEALASSFRSQGFSLVPLSEGADLYVVNTCTVTSRSDQKAHRLIRRLSRERPGALVVATGCYAQLNRPELESLGGNVRVVAQDAKNLLLRLPQEHAAEPTLPLAELPLFSDAGAGATLEPFAYRVERFSCHSRGFLKIQDGCDGRCAYCRVPLARGASVSLGADEAVARLLELERAGYREVVLTGVNISDYHGGLEHLLRRMLAQTRDVRLRLSSLEPERITVGLAEAVSDPRVRPHFHVPVQSGSDRVLSAMRRRYSADLVERGIALLRQAKGDPFVAGDFIVGFPGEGDQDFAASRELIQRLALSALHVFPFSPRPGTEAVEMRPRVAERERDQRAGELLALSERLHRRYVARFAEARLEAVLEEPLPDSEAPAWRGLTENYLHVEITGIPPGQGRAGGLVEVVFLPELPPGGVPARLGTGSGHGRYLGPA